MFSVALDVVPTPGPTTATVILTIPGKLAGAIALMLLLLIRVPLTETVPKVTTIEEREGIKPLPLIITAVPPLVLPEVGEMDDKAIASVNIVSA